jgi:hypothetical protein
MQRVGAAGLRGRVIGVIALGVLALGLSQTSLLAASLGATLVLAAVAYGDSRFPNARAFGDRGMLGT